MTSVRGVYRQLLRTVKMFPKEKILELSKDTPSFAQVATNKIRQEFKSSITVDPTTAAKNFATAQKELKALTSLLANEHSTRYPGPKAPEKLLQ